MITTTKPKRKRFKVNAIASSENYTASKRNNRANLLANHIENEEFFNSIRSMTIQKSELQLFEEGLKRQIAAFKQSRK